MKPQLALYGNDLFGDPIEPLGRGPVAKRFTFPPFSVLNAREGEWQERKRAWIAMGIEGEVGRNPNVVPNGTVRPPEHDGCYQRGTARSYYRNRAIKTQEWVKSVKGEDFTGLSGGLSGVSIFDPVLTELAYRWWCPEGGQIVDPFAGGSVRGIVAAALGRHYWGCDLRQEQIDANATQAASIAVDGPNPAWVCGDSMETLNDAPAADFVFSCPPYGDLEKYSDDPADLSNMEWHTFLANYKRIILRACQRLKPDRFACFVVGDFRDKKGFYRNFVSETIAGFEACGVRLYNEAILVTSVGSASMRVTKQFSAGRKLCKTHQNVLVFCKGDWRKAAGNLAECEDAKDG